MSVPLLLLLAAAPLGPCADRAACTVRVKAGEALRPAALVALAANDLKEGEPKAPAIALKPKTLKGDTAFALEVEAGEGDEIIVRALSLHRSPSVYGLARVVPQPVPKAKQKVRALQLALQRGIEQAMIDLTGQILEAAGQGQRRLRLSVQVTGLELASRQYVDETWLPCLKGQVDSLGAVTQPKEVSGYLEDELLYAPAADEPRESLQWQTDRFRAAVSGLKAPCTLAAGPLARAKVVFTADALNHAVVVTIAK